MCSLFQSSSLAGSFVFAGENTLRLPCFLFFFPPGDYYLLTAPAEAVHVSMCPIIWFIKFFQQIMITPQTKQIIIFCCLCMSTRLWTNGYKCMNGGFQVSSYQLFPTYTLKRGLTLNLELIILASPVRQLLWEFPVCLHLGWRSSRKVHLTLTMEAEDSNSCPNMVQQVLQSMSCPSCWGSRLSD